MSEDQKDLTAPEQSVAEMVADISANHAQILDDWCKACLAQEYEETGRIRPSELTLHHQYLPGTMSYRYWFTKTDTGEEQEEEKHDKTT